MATIKKAYQAIASLLAANPKSTCLEIYSQFEALASAKVGGGGGGVTSFHKVGDDVLVARCSYHGLYFHTADVEFGKKASSASGLNTMCKDGMSKWTKQYADFKKAKEQLLTDVMKGEIEAGDVQAIVADLEVAREAVVAMTDSQGFASLEDAIEAL